MSVRLGYFSPQVRPRTVEGTPRETAATLQYGPTAVKRAASPLNAPRPEVRSLHSQEQLGKSVPQVRPATASVSGHQSPAPVSVLRLFQHPRAASPQPSPSPRPPEQRTLPVDRLLSQERTAVDRLFSQERTAVDRRFSQERTEIQPVVLKIEQPPQQEARVSQHMPTAALHMELKELKRILDKQYGSHQKLGSFVEPHFSADDEQRVAKQVQLVQKVASVAPESKVRELCVNVACQQAEQEIFLRTMSDSLERLHKEVQDLQPPNIDRHTQSVETLGLDVEPSEISAPANSVRSDGDSGAKRSQDSMDAMKVMLDAELQASFADFCVNTMQETLGEELQRQSDSIKSLKIQMECLKELTKQSFTSVEQAETVKNLKEQMRYLNEVTSQSLAALHSLIKQVVTGIDVEEPIHNSVLPRKLHTIMESAGDAGDAEGDRAEIASWVQTVYRDIVAQNPPQRPPQPAESRTSGSNNLNEASPAASTSDVYPALSKGTT